MTPLEREVFDYLETVLQRVRHELRFEMATHHTYDIMCVRARAIVELEARGGLLERFGIYSAWDVEGLRAEVAPDSLESVRFVWHVTGTRFNEYMLAPGVAPGVP